MTILMMGQMKSTFSRMKLLIEGMRVLVSLIGNIIWFLTGGGFMGLSWYLAGLFWTMTIIGIPVGKQ